MRKPLSSTILVVIMVLLAAGTIWSAADLNTEYLMKVGDYFEVSYDDVDAIASGNIAIEEVPTVFFMAQLSDKSPEYVLNAYEISNSWASYMTFHRIHPSEVMVKIYNFNTPECKAVKSKIKNRPLKSVKFDNQDINLMVNCRMIAETKNIEYSEVINKRNNIQGNTTSFVEINHMSIDQSELATSDSK